MTHGVGGHQSAVSASGEARVAIVTGASLGIGRGIAVRLGRLGCRVVVNFLGSEADAAHTVRAIEEDAPIAARGSAPDPPSIWAWSTQRRTGSFAPPSNPSGARHSLRPPS
jgi:NAD(P)-dependent dehydrogenase (short-subunit alcohol dehydrogenase family)